MVEEPSHVKQLSPKPRVWSRVKRYYPVSLQFLLKTYKAFFFLFSSWAFQILLHPPTENLFLFTLWKLWCVFLEQHSLFLCWIKLCTHTCTLRAVCCQKAENIPRGRILGWNTGKSFPPYYSQSPQYLASRFLFLSTHATSGSFYSLVTVHFKGDRRKTW
jgi:hypothetical protein